MALFGKKTEKKVAKKVEKKAPAVKAVATKNAKFVSTEGLIRPRITEKAGVIGEAHNIFTFEVSKNSTKHSVAHAIQALYNVTPTKVRIINLPAKNVIVRGRRGTVAALKKALVFLKKGDTIEIA